jgi:hypothetical protein
VIFQLRLPSTRVMHTRLGAVCNTRFIFVLAWPLAGLERWRLMWDHTPIVNWLTSIGHYLGSVTNSRLHLFVMGHTYRYIYMYKPGHKLGGCTEHETTFATHCCGDVLSPSTVPACAIDCGSTLRLRAVMQHHLVASRAARQPT